MRLGVSLPSSARGARGVSPRLGTRRCGGAIGQHGARLSRGGLLRSIPFWDYSDHATDESFLGAMNTMVFDIFSTIATRNSFHISTKCSFHSYFHMILFGREWQSLGTSMAVKHGFGLVLLSEVRQSSHNINRDGYKVGLTR